MYEIPRMSKPIEIVRRHHLISANLQSKLNENKNIFVKLSMVAEWSDAEYEVHKLELIAETKKRNGLFIVAWAKKLKQEIEESIARKDHYYQPIDLVHILEVGKFIDFLNKLARAEHFTPEVAREMDVYFRALFFGELTSRGEPEGGLSDLEKMRLERPPKVAKKILKALKGGKGIAVVDARGTWGQGKELSDGRREISQGNDYDGCFLYLEHPKFKKINEGNLREKLFVRGRWPHLHCKEPLDVKPKLSSEESPYAGLYVQFFLIRGEENEFLGKDLVEIYIAYYDDTTVGNYGAAERRGDVDTRNGVQRFSFILPEILGIEFSNLLGKRAKEIYKIINYLCPNLYDFNAPYYYQKSNWNMQGLEFVWARGLYWEKGMSEPKVLNESLKKY